MSDLKKYEKQFFDALRDIFVGAKVEGDSGFINLMRIKSRYYELGVFPQLHKDIATALQPFPDFREELFDKLYTFFQRYFSESGSIYFRYTALHQNIYEKVYTDDRDVMLFWKTHMLYYVKTDRIFTSLNVEVDEIGFFFDASKMTLKRANEKRATVYIFRNIEADGTLVFDVFYSEKGKTTKVDDILKAARQAGQPLSDDTLAKAFRVFEKQSEVDYFINKNARLFLQEQFDLWMYQYLFTGQNVWSAERLAQLQALKSIAYKVIDFISQFEDELVKVWNKPKFVRNSHYIITVDHIIASAATLAAPARASEQSPATHKKEIASGKEHPRNDLMERILTHPNLTQQVQEWRDLGMLGADFRLGMLTEKDLTGAPLYPQYQFLPLDTKYFPDLEVDILALFDNLDAALDGWLVHSENYQALNTLLPKFKGQIKCIYIDPPYNSESSEITYVNNYKSSSWLSIMQNRLDLARHILSDKGMIGIAIDDFEFNNLTHLISNYFTIIGKVVVRSNPAGRSTSKGFSINHEYTIFASKDDSITIGYSERNQEQTERYKEEDESGRFEWVNFRKHGGLRIESPKMFYPIYLTRGGSFRIPKIVWSVAENMWVTQAQKQDEEIVVFPIDANGQERRWKWSVERFSNNTEEIKVDHDREGNLAIYIKSRMPIGGILPGTWWDDKEYSATDWGAKILKELFGEHGTFSYPKATKLLERCLKTMTLGDSEIILDFFAGSGTTTHAVMNLNREDGGKRKYILVEMGEHFNTVILPRIKKVAFSDTWKDGKANGGQGMSHFAKYYDLEQYEDVLRRSRYADADLFDNPYEDPYQRYVFLRDEKMLAALEVDVEKNTVHVHPERLYADIDLAETLSQRRGKWIKRITQEQVEFQDGEKYSLTEPDWQLMKPLIWW
jgi:adenine-specific DNA-methyltransferase